jgi:hypothetical protein
MGRGSDRGLGIDWTFPVQKGFIDNRGETLIHEIGLRCPCNIEDTMAGQMTRKDVPRRRTTYRCPNCSGEGYIYRNPKKIIALITGISESTSRQEEGWIMPGDAIMSPKPGYIVSTGDLITFTWSQPIDEGQVIVRGAATLSENAARKTDIDEAEDRLWYNADESIWCEDYDGKIYKPGDFILDGSKRIRWQGNSPPIGKAYTLKYKAYLEWEAFQPPVTRRDRDRDLGGRVLLRKRHVAQVNDDPTIRQRDKLTFCARMEGC